MKEVVSVWINNKGAHRPMFLLLFFFLGTITTLALPPFFMWGVLYITFPLFLFLCEKLYIKEIDIYSKSFPSKPFSSKILSLTISFFKIIASKIAFFTSIALKVTPSRTIFSKTISSRAISSRITPSRILPPKNTPPQNTLPKNIPLKNTPSENTFSENTSSQKNSSRIPPSNPHPSNPHPSNLHPSKPLFWNSPFVWGYCFGFGYFIAGLYWLSYSVMNYGVPWWASWLAPVGLSGLLAFYIGGALWILFKISSPIRRWFLFVVVWCVAEWIRGNFLTGFPWNLLGYSWSGNSSLSLLPSVFGVYGSSFVLLLSVMMVSSFLIIKSRIRACLLFFFGVVVLISCLIGGGIIKEKTHHLLKKDSWVGVRLVPGDISERKKEDIRLWGETFQKYVYLSQKDRPSWVRLIIWPETAVPVSIQHNEDVEQVLKKLVPSHGYLMAGAVEREPFPNGERLYNSLDVLNRQGFVARYDKVHLVPFGEYIPFPYVAKWIGMNAFSKGKGSFVLSLADLPRIAPMICYESIFPYDAKKKGHPSLFVNITNDAWFGRSVEQTQHFYQSGVRAIEQGIPLIRVANMGKSGIFYPDGTFHVMGEEQHNVGFMDIKVYKIHAPTLYQHYHDKLFFILLLILVLFIFGVM